jgi:LmbE family N-acetylglucosaminyl deacetylase
MNIVSIMAHADDEMRCLGTMLKCRARGDSLHFVTVADGSVGFAHQPDLSRADAAAIRAREMDALGAAVGAQHTTLGERDGFLYDTPEVRARMIQTIRATRADVIFTHYPDDYNADHTVVSAMVRHCTMLASYPREMGLGVPLAKHPAIFMIEPHGIVTFPASVVVDISGFAEEKLRLLRTSHASQETAMQKAHGRGFDQLVGTTDAYWGQKAGCGFAEVFAPMHGRGSIRPGPLLP